MIELRDYQNKAVEELFVRLERMLKSTIGFSDLVEKNNHSLIIQQKHDFFLKNIRISLFVPTLQSLRL